MDKPFSLGIYGGTFSPPHRGHIAAAEAFLQQCGLDHLLIMPTAIPPHKQIDPSDLPERRLEMARLAFSTLTAYQDRLEVSDYEVLRGDRSYTYLTLEHFTAPGRKLTFLCGTDMFLSLDRWREPTRIFELASIALVRRETGSAALDAEIAHKKAFYEEHFGAHIVPIEGEPVEISSTELRHMLSTGSPTDLYLTPEVEAYIKEHGLYQTKEGSLS